MYSDLASATLPLTLPLTTEQAGGSYTGSSFTDWLGDIFMPDKMAAYRTADQNRVNMLFNMNEAQKDRDFQERLSNTAYQRAVVDMRKAGINPILAFQQGGASTPSGASSSVSGSSSGSGELFKGVIQILSGLIKLGAEAIKSSSNSMATIGF